MLVDMVDKYAWTEEDHDFVWTVAVITGRTRDEVIRIYGGNPADPVGNYTFAQLNGLQGPGEPVSLRFHLQVLNQDKYVVTMENNGYTGATPEIARRCSAKGGQFFSVFWNVNGTYSITQAVDGTVTAFFDPLLAGPKPWPGWVYSDWLNLDDFAVEEIRPVCLAYMERQTGLEFDRHWLNDPRPTYRIPDPDGMLKDVETMRLP